MSDGGPDQALDRLGELLRADGSVVSPHVTATTAQPHLGRLAAAGPRAASAPAEYALVVEAVREGYLLHYDQDAARVVRGADDDSALLAGDYLYALGLERLAELGDQEAVARAFRPDQPCGAGSRRRSPRRPGRGGVRGVVAGGGGGHRRRARDGA